MFAATMIGLLLAAFIITMVQIGEINAVETDVATLKTNQQTLEAASNNQIVPFSHTSGGPIQPSTQIQYIDVAAVAALTLPIDLTPYVNNKICLISHTAFAHTVTLGAGTTWDGANTVATYGGAANDAVCFIVTSLTSLLVISSNNIVFS